jgi:hypothetical protein
MEVNGELTQIGIQTTTDKANYHNFTAVYERFLHDKKERISKVLEIGVYHGASIQMWEKYLPKAIILGLDINSQYFTERIFSDRVKLAICDATSVEQLTKTMNSHGFEPNTVDLIIDDGSHLVSHQVKTIGLTWKYVKPGGLYILEDIHTAVPLLIGRHAHIPHDGGYIDEQPTTDQRVLGTMYGYPNLFSGLPIDEIEHVAYVSNVKTMSLTCIFTKKASQ